MSAPFNPATVPVPVPYMAGGVQRYLEHGVRPGKFLTALFSNDLEGAFRKADENNKAALQDWVQFMRRHMPAETYGSSEAVDAWIARHEARVAL